MQVGKVCGVGIGEEAKRQIAELVREYRDATPEASALGADWEQSVEIGILTAELSGDVTESVTALTVTTPVRASTENMLILDLNALAVNVALLALCSVKMCLTHYIYCQ